MARGRLRYSVAHWQRPSYKMPKGGMRIAVLYPTPKTVSIPLHIEDSGLVDATEQTEQPKPEEKRTDVLGR